MDGKDHSAFRAPGVAHGLPGNRLIRVATHGVAGEALAEVATVRRIGLRDLTSPTHEVRASIAPLDGGGYDFPRRIVPKARSSRPMSGARYVRRNAEDCVIDDKLEVVFA